MVYLLGSCHCSSQSHDLLSCSAIGMVEIVAHSVELCLDLVMVVETAKQSTTNKDFPKYIFNSLAILYSLIGL
jgi:hypothetical protein